MAIPVDVQQFLVGDLGRVVVNLDRLGVTPQAVVGGVLFVATGIADAGADDTGYTPEPGVGAPESTQGKGCCLGLSGR